MADTGAALKIDAPTAATLKCNRAMTDSGFVMRMPIVGRRLILTDFGVNATDEGQFREMYSQPGLVFWATRPSLDTPDEKVQELIGNFYKQITEGDFRPTEGGWTRRTDYRLAVRFKHPELYNGDIQDELLFRPHADPAELPLVGYVSLNGLTLKNIHQPDGEPDMGTTIHPSYQGRGLATEMLALLAFQYLDCEMGKIYATRHPDNVGAEKSQARSGFIDTGTSELSTLTGETQPRINSEMSLRTFMAAPEWARLKPFTRRYGE